MLARNLWGRIIGCVLGLCLGGPWGAVIGYLIGRIYDKQLAPEGNIWSGLRQSSYEQFSAYTEQVTFALGIIVLSAKMARSDGQVTRAEIRAFKRVFSITRSQEDVVSHIFNQARSSADGFEPYAARLAQVFRNSPAVLEGLLSDLFIIGAADGPLSPAEIAFLKQVSSIFGFGAEDFVRIAARSGIELPPQESQGSQGSQRSQGSPERPRPHPPGPFEILGVCETATAAEIKAAYYSLIREHHPDKLMASGMPPEFIATATEKMKRINVAYDTACKIRGFR